jgi:hypothetical protein
MRTLNGNAFSAIFLGAQGLPGRCNVPLTRGTCNDTEACIEEGTESSLWHSLLPCAHRSPGSSRGVPQAATTRGLPGGLVRRRSRGVDRLATARIALHESFFGRVEARCPNRASLFFYSSSVAGAKIWPLLLCRSPRVRLRAWISFGIYHWKSVLTVTPYQAKCGVRLRLRVAEYRYHRRRRGGSNSLARLQITR